MNHDPRRLQSVESITLATSGRTTSRLGYGCSSLMGATGRSASLRLLEEAFSAGIRHFDVAPMYGYGAAEGCLGEFLARHRGEVTVATKYGIPPARNRALLRVARRFAGPIVQLLPAAKRRLARAADTVAAPVAKASFTAAEARASIERSLRELRTDRIDLLLLHEVEATDLAHEVGDDGLLRLLEDFVAAGKLGCFGTGSSSGKIPGLLADRPAYCGVLQFEWSVLDPVRALPGFTLHHRALTDNFRALHAALAADAPLSRRWSEEVGAELAEREVLAALMLKASLELNPASVVLFSSRDPAHIRHNVEVAADAALAEPARRLHAVVQREGFPGERPEP